VVVGIPCCVRDSRYSVVGIACSVRDNRYSVTRYSVHSVTRYTSCSLTHTHNTSMRHAVSHTTHLCVAIIDRLLQIIGLFCRI